MARGKQKGHQKAMLTIMDEMLEPYYITLDESQYTLMTEGSTLPIGYYNNLGNTLQKIARLLTVKASNQEQVNLSEYLNRYDAISTKLNNTINI